MIDSFYVIIIGDRYYERNYSRSNHSFPLPKKLEVKAK